MPSASHSRTPLPVRARRASLLAALLVVAPALRAQQAPPDRIQLNQYLDWQDVQSPQVSPDGSQIVYGRRHVDKMNDRWRTSLWIMNADGTHDRYLADGSDAQWSPDGKRIAYVAEGQPSGAQIFVKWVDL